MRPGENSCHRRPHSRRWLTPTTVHPTAEQHSTMMQMRHRHFQGQMRTRGTNTTPPLMMSRPRRRILPPKTRRGHVLGRRPRTLLSLLSVLVSIVRILMLMNNNCALTPWLTARTTHSVAPTPLPPGQLPTRVDPLSSYRQIVPPP